MTWRRAGADGASGWDQKKNGSGKQLMDEIR